MESPFLKRLEAKNFGCLTDVSIALTPIHALIGPNDSGKSTILRAARTLVDLLAQTPLGAFHPDHDLLASSGLEFEKGPRLLADCGILKLEVEASAGNRQGALTLHVGPEQSGIGLGGRLAASGLFNNIPGIQAIERSNPGLLRLVAGGARLLRLDPDALREASTLIPETERLRLYDERGHGLPGVYDAILNRGDESFLQIVGELRRLFPTIKGLRLRVVSESTKILEVELTHGERVPAQFMSEGLLYYLAFAAVRHLVPTSILLVEEPENGLHPIRIAEVMRMLREISKTTQVLIATHSPLVVNELSGDEVTLVTRDPDRGTQVRKLSSTANFLERSKVYALGELWLSYADGSEEKDLLSPSQS